MNVIDLGYDLDKLTPQQKVVVEYLNTTINLADELDGRKISPDIAGIGDFNKALGQSKKTTDELSLSVDAYNKQLTITATNQAKANALQSDAGKTMISSKIALSDQNKELTNSVKLQESVNHSVGEARALVTTLTAERDKLNLSTTAGKNRQAELNQQIDLNNKFIQENVSHLEKQKINIGNYSGATEGLEKIMNGLKVQIDQATQAFGANSAQTEKLQAQYQTVNTLIKEQAKGFASATMQQRNSERAIRTLNEAGLGTGKIFDEMRMSVAETGRSLNEFGISERMLESETPTLMSLTSAAKGLSGAYAAGSGAVALFGDENGKLQEKLQPLMAIMALMQGLQEFQELLSKKNAILLVLESDATNVLTKAKELLGLSTKKNIAAEEAQQITQAETAASMQATAAATEETTVASEELAVGMTELSVATDAMAVSSEAGAAAVTELAGGMDVLAGSEAAAETAAFGLADAIIATGIGALIIAIGIGIYELVKVVKDWNAANESVIKSNEDLDASMKALVDATKAYEAIRIQADKDSLDAQAKQNEIAKARGVTQAQELAMDKKLAQSKLDLANKEALRYNVNAATYKNALQQSNDSADMVRYEEKKKQEYIKQTTTQGDKDYDKRVKQFDESIDKYKKEAEANAAIFEFAKGITDQQKEQKDTLDKIAATTEKMSGDDKRKVDLESARLSADAVISANSLILSNEYSTQAERITAMKSTLSEQKVIAKAEMNDVLLNTTSSDADKIIARKKYNEDVNKLNEDAKAAEKKLNDDYRLAELEAYTKQNNDLLETQEDQDKKIFESHDKSLQERLEALNDYNSKRLKVIDDNEALEIQKAKGNALAIVQIQSDALKARNAIFADHDKSYTGIVKDDFEVQQKKSKDEIETPANDKLTGLSMSFNKSYAGAAGDPQKQKELLEQYNRDKLAIQDQYQIDSLKSDLKYTEAMLADAKARGVDTTEAEKNISEVKKNIADAEVKQTQDQQAAKNAKVKEWADNTLTSLSYVQKGYEVLYTAIDGLVKASTEKQLAALQKQEDANNRLKETETRNIQKSTVSNQQKAAQLEMLNARTAADNEALERKKKDAQIKEAQFEKDASILKITLSTAEAVAKAVSESPETFGLPFSAFAAALGAAQLAVAIATPIPKYALGTDDHPGGPAIFGEAGRERVIFPSGYSFIAEQAILADLPAHTKVIPLDDNMVGLSAQNASIKNMARTMSIDQSRNKGNDILANKVDELTKATYATGRMITAAVKNQRHNTNIYIDTVHNAHIDKYVRK